MRNSSSRQIKRYSGHLLTLLILLLSGCGGAISTPESVTAHAQEGSMAADISPDGTLAVVSSVENGITVWDLQQQTARFEWHHQGEGENIVTNLHIAANNSHVVTSDRTAFALWDVSSGEPVGFWRIDESAIRDVAVSNYGNAILVARSNGKIMYFEPNSGRRLEFLGHQEKVNSIDLSPNGKFALSGSNDYVAYLWSTDSGQVIHTFTHPQRVTKVALDDQGRFAFTADSTNNAKIWDVQSGELISSLDIFVRQQIFTDAVFAENGKWLLTGSPSRRVNLWDISTGKEIQEWRVAPNEKAALRTAVVNAVGFINEHAIVTESSSGLAEVWRIPEHE
ncbi:WD40 repeat domain-containing protein [Alteromonas facilis]|uniref:WD40 repeat domain-containing protein n=1 Tax=Alteromonas facilis TaxID=2048004 RepID=UPI000C285957